MQLLCATDDSIAGAAALRVAVELADRLRDELARLDAGASDPAPQLLRTARASGCDRIVVGVVRGGGLSRGSVPAGWQHRVVRCAPSPVILVPVGTALPHGAASCSLTTASFRARRHEWPDGWLRASVRRCSSRICFLRPAGRSIVWQGS